MNKGTGYLRMLSVPLIAGVLSGCELDQTPTTSSFDRITEWHDTHSPFTDEEFRRELGIGPLETLASRESAPTVNLTPDYHVRLPFSAEELRRELLGEEQPFYSKRNAYTTSSPNNL